MAVVDEVNSDQNGSTDNLASGAPGDGVLNGHCDEDALIVTKIVTGEDNCAHTIVLNGEVAILETGDDAELFRKAAKSFLAAHREEIFKRDLQIQELRAELLRIQETINPKENNGEQADVQSKCAEPAVEEQQSDVDGSQAPSQIAIDSEDKSVKDAEKMTDSGIGLDGLIQDDTDKVVQEIESIWSGCVKAVQLILDDDLPEDYLSKWNPTHWTALEEKLPRVRAISQIGSNTSTAKKIRAKIAMGIVAQTLEEYILTPNYLLEEDDELRYILRSLVDIPRKNSLRNLLISVSEEANRKEDVKGTRVSASIEDITQALESLLPGDMLGRLKSELERELKNATLGWEPVQRYHSHYEVNAAVTQTPWDWKSISFTDEGVSLLDVNSAAFAEDEAVLVVFPRVCAIDRSRKPSYTVVFPGIVLQKSQTELKECDLQATLADATPEGAMEADATATGDSLVEAENNATALCEISNPTDSDASEEGGTKSE